MDDVRRHQDRFLNSRVSGSHDPAFSSTLASSPTNWPISRTTSARGRLIASARRRTMALPMIRPSATGASCAHLVRAADPEPDADGQGRLRPQPADGLDQLRRQALPFAGDPGDRDVVDESGGRPGDLDGTLAGRRRGDELDQLEVAPGGLLEQGPGFLDRQIGNDQAVESGGRRVVEVSLHPQPVDDRIGDHRDHAACR